MKTRRLDGFLLGVLSVQQVAENALRNDPPGNSAIGSNPPGTNPPDLIQFRLVIFSVSN